MNIFRLVASSTAVVVTIIFLGAHEEPVKTLKEKAERETDRVKIRNAGIRKIVTKEYALAEGRETGHQRLTMIQEYDQSGRLVAVEAYQEEKATARVECSCDRNFNVAEQKTFRPPGNMIDRDVFEYDDAGRVLAGKTYNPKGEVEETFQYIYDPDRKKISFVKYQGGQEPDYTVEYLYASDYDKEGSIEIVKRDGKGNVILKVKDVRDAGGRRTDKILFDQDLKETKRFHYEYTAEGQLFKVTTVVPGPNGPSIKTYAYDERGICREERELSADGSLVSLTRHEFQYFPDRSAEGGSGKGDLHLGGEVRIGEATPIAELSAHPEKWFNRNVRIEGVIVSACNQEGCFIEVAPESGPGEGVLVNFADPGLKFPTDCAGCKVVVEGMFYQKVYPASRVAHWQNHSFRKGKAVPPFALIKRMIATAADLSAGKVEIPAPGEIVQMETHTMDLSAMEFETEGFGTGKKVLGPGESTPEHSTGSVREMIFCLEGEVAIRQGEAEPYILKAGEMSFIPPSTKHELKNEGHTRCTYIFVFAKAEAKAGSEEKHDH